MLNNKNDEINDELKNHESELNKNNFLSEIKDILSN